MENQSIYFLSAVKTSWMIFFRIEFFCVYLFEVFTSYNILGTYITISILFYRRSIFIIQQIECTIKCIYYTSGESNSWANADCIFRSILLIWLIEQHNKVNRMMMVVGLRRRRPSTTTSLWPSWLSTKRFLPSSHLHSGSCGLVTLMTDLLPHILLNLSICSMYVLCGSVPNSSTFFVLLPRK